MSDNYRFINHRQCEYFPCHKGITEEDFNCLFCFCPLYALKDKCGGNFKFTENGIKDCSACTLPHGPNGYDHIMSKMSMVMELGKNK